MRTAIGSGALPRGAGNCGVMLSKRTVTSILLVGIALLLGLLTTVFVIYRDISENPTQLVEALPDGADISIDDIRHTAVKDGRKEWELEAASARYSDSAQTARFEDVRVVFFMENDREVTVTGRQGRLDTVTNDIQLSGDVVVQDADYELTTERLRYDQEDRTIHVPVPVRVEGKAFTVQAEAMTVDLETETARFAGAVEGVFRGTPTPRP